MTVAYFADDDFSYSTFGGEWSFSRMNGASDPLPNVVGTEALVLPNDVAAGGVTATWTAGVVIQNFTFQADRFYDLGPNPSDSYIAHTFFNLLAADGSSIVISLSPLLSDVPADYGNDIDNYGNPRLDVFFGGESVASITEYARLQSVQVLNQWRTANYSLDSDTGVFVVDMRGFGIPDFIIQSPNLIGAGLTSITFDSYGANTGQSVSLDNVMISGEVASVEVVYKSQAALDAAMGHLLLEADLALASYTLRQYAGGDDAAIAETVAEYINNESNAAAVETFELLADYIDFFDGDDLGTPLSGLSSNETFGQNGLWDGIYTNRNASALVGRTDTTLYLTFRGTNDGSSTGDDDSADQQHWLGPFVGRQEHFDLFAPLLSALRTYLDHHPEITSVVAGGHSLGMAMATYLHETNMFGDRLVTTGFANPGLSVLDVPDTIINDRLSYFHIKGDVIGLAQEGSREFGDANTIHHNLEGPMSTNELHSMINYERVVAFLAQEGVPEGLFFGEFGFDYDHLTIHASLGIAGYYQPDAPLAQEPFPVFSDIGGGADNLRGYETSFTVQVGGNSHTTTFFYDDVIVGGAGNDTIDGAGGQDYLHGGADDDQILGGAQNDQLFGVTENDLLYGGKGDDSLFGGTGLDTLYGDQHADTLSGQDQNDSMSGGDGNDNLYGGADDDGLTGDKGTDLLTGDAGNDTLRGGAANDDLFGGLDQDEVYGDNAADTLHGDAQNDLLWGGEGNDQLYGGTEQDSLTGDKGDDLLAGGDGIDTLRGGIGNDDLFGGLDEDSLYGENGDDTLSGDDGNDTLVGGIGADQMSGGAGADIFVFEKLGDSFAIWDRISDFTAIPPEPMVQSRGPVDFDVIDLSAIDANRLTLGTDDAFLFIGYRASDSAPVLTPGVLWYNWDQGETHIFVNTNLSAAPDMRIILDGEITLHSWNFLI